MSGKRWSAQVRIPLKGPAPVTGALSAAAMSGSLRVFADHEDGVAGVAMRRNGEVGRGGRALEHPRGEIEARVVARAVIAARPVGTHVRRRADFLLERCR